MDESNNDLFAIIQDNATKRLRRQMEQQRQQAQQQQRNEIASAAYGALRYAYADLPTASAARIGWLAFVTDGRRSGQGAGAGSGVLCYCAETALASGLYAWYRVSDDTQVVI